jgi:hypothetical protein
LRLSLWKPGTKIETMTLGQNLRTGERPQAVVPAGVWQMAECPSAAEAWTLVGCGVAPAFEFARFEMAPSGWKPDENGP